MMKKIQGKYVQYCLLVVGLIGFIAVYLAYQPRNINFIEISSDLDNSSIYLINNPGCKIWNVNPFNQEVMKLGNSTTKYDCLTSQSRSLTIVAGNILRIDETVAKQKYNDSVTSCSYESIQRVSNSDDNFRYGQPVGFINFTKLINADEIEFVRVKCYNRSNETISTDFHAIVSKKTWMDVMSDISRERFKSKNSYNVMLIAVDSTSRLNSIRKLPRTRTFILNELKAVEMLGFTRVGLNSFPNILPLITGIDTRQFWWRFSCDGLPLIWKNFFKLGYWTLYGEEGESGNGAFSYGGGGFRKRPTDFYLRPLLLAVEKEPKSNGACYGSKFESEFLTQWATDFVEFSRTNQRPFFAFTHFSRLSHSSANDVALLDTPLLEFLRNLNNNSHLNNTVLFLFGDHGSRWGEVRNTAAGEYEENLPMMLVYLPPRLRQEYPDMFNSLKLNSKRLTTFFDVHRTLEHLLHFPNQEYRFGDQNSKRSMSLLSPIPATRTCKDADVEPFCVCISKTSERISNSNPTVIHLANAAIQHMNSEMRIHGGACVALDLKNVTKAIVSKQNMKSEPLYSIEFKVSPSNGRFLAKVYHTLGSWIFGTHGIKLLGDIVRVNRYGNQSDCIHHSLHRTWCYCVWRNNSYNEY